ncbi:MAG TPA: hypothetical protein VIJ95_02065 [Hanamia sp.]
MKKILLISLLIAGLNIIPRISDAQLQKGNTMIGGDLANLNFILGGGGYFQATINPKVAFFFHDNIALGGMINFGLATGKGAGTTTNYGVSLLGRYYFNKPVINLAHRGRFFLEVNAGIQGESLAGGSNTKGLGIGIGPGYAFFVTQNVSLETLLKYNGIVGFGNNPYDSNLDLNIGFQIYLPGRKATTILKSVM